MIQFYWKDDVDYIFNKRSQIINDSSLTLGSGELMRWIRENKKYHKFKALIVERLRENNDKIEERIKQIIAINIAAFMGYKCIRL